MGQQQLLLIVLGVILVALAVVVGIRLFAVNSIEANKDALVLDCVSLATLAQQYYHKPIGMGGGGKSFAGWNIPTLLQSNEDGSFQAVVSRNEVVINGTGVEKELNGDEITVQVTVTSNSFIVSRSGGDDDDDGGGNEGGGDDDDDD
jgi:hypothetical protein